MGEREELVNLGLLEAQKVPPAPSDPWNVSGKESPLDDFSIKLLNLIHAGILSPSSLTAIGSGLQSSVTDNTATLISDNRYAPEVRLYPRRGRAIHVALRVPPEEEFTQEHLLRDFVLKAIEQFKPTTNEEAVMRAYIRKENPPF